MDVSQYLYAGLVGAFLILVAAVWLFVRARNPGAARIEPGMGTKAPNDGLVPRAELKAEPEDDEAPPVVDDLANAKAEPPAELGAKAPERPIEQGYKGFKIQLREKQPGLWVASIADSASRNRKRQADRASVTHEYYQLPAALAEAKVLIDRRLAARH